MNNQTMIIIHGGAGPASAYIQANIKEYQHGLKAALRAAQVLLGQGMTVLDAVCTAVSSLEANPLFNADYGSALNHLGEIEMDAAVMDESTLNAGAVAMLSDIAHPTALARQVMEKTGHVLLAVYVANDFADSMGMQRLPKGQLVTQHELDALLAAKKESQAELLQKLKEGNGQRGCP